MMSSSHLLLLSDAIPTDVWSATVLLMLDARDLIVMDTVVALHPPAAFVAKRVLQQGELRWFAERNVPLVLLSERRVVNSAADALLTSLAPSTLLRAQFPVVAWTINGELQRDGDLPALECANGDMAWCLRGKLHRAGDLPAIECANGPRTWSQNGERHRDNDLPAVEYPDGSRFWYRHGKCHRDNDMPAAVDSDGSLRWYVNDEKHRDNDLPATITADGRREWWIRGSLRREGGRPVIERADGVALWWRGGHFHLGRWADDSR